VVGFCGLYYPDRERFPAERVVGKFRNQGGARFLVGGRHAGDLFAQQIADVARTAASYKTPDHPPVFNLSASSASSAEKSVDPDNRSPSSFNNHAKPTRHNQKFGVFCVFSGPFLRFLSILAPI